MSIEFASITWTPDNLMPQDDASAETTIGTWHATLNGTVTATPSAVHALDGTHSIEVTVGAAGDAVFLTGEGQAGIPVLGGTPFAGQLRVLAGSVGRSVHMSAVFYDTYGGLLSGETIAGATVSDTTGGWAMLPVTGTVPADAAFFAAKLTITAGGAGEKHYIDQAYVTPAASLPVTFTVGLGDVFAAYEIWMDDGAGYQQIAEISSLLISQFETWMPRLGVQASFRMRTRTFDGAVSAWTAVKVVTLDADGCKYQFVTDEDPTLNVSYDDIGPDRAYDFSDTSATVQLYNRDYPVVFRALEATGDRFTISLHLAGAPQIVPLVAGRTVFDPALEIARARLSFVCVKDSDGNRWFAALFPKTGTRSEPHGTYKLDVDVVQIAPKPATPSVLALPIGTQPPPIVIGTGPGGGTPSPSPTPGPTPSPTPSPSPGGPAAFVMPDSSDALQEKILQDVTPFYNWLATNAVKGAITEVGWSDLENSGLWNAAGEKWYEYADNAIQIVTYHDGGGKPRGNTFALSAYGWTGSTWALRGPHTVLEAHETANRGATFDGPEYWGAMGTAPDATTATVTFSNVNLGTADTDYVYPKADWFTFAAGKGLKVVRISPRWERLQPTFNAALRSSEVTQLTNCLAAAVTAGMKVIIGIKNFGAYYVDSGDSTHGTRTAINTVTIPNSYLADFWSRMATAFGSNAGLYGFELMHEPTGIPTGTFATPALAWENASQLCVNVIRAVTGALILVPGYDFQNANRWPVNHPADWITDPGGANANIVPAAIGDNEGAVSWAVTTGAATLTNGTAQAKTGTHSLQAVATSSADLALEVPFANRFTVVAGTVYSPASIFVRGTNVKYAVFAINWYTSGGAFISASVIAQGNCDTASWTSYSAVVTAPATAAAATLKVLIVAPTVGQTYYVDSAVMGGTSTPNFVYSAHDYFDRNLDGQTLNGYPSELTYATGLGYHAVTRSTPAPSPGPSPGPTPVPPSPTPTPTPSPSGSTWWRTGANPPTGPKKALMAVSGDVNITTPGLIYDGKAVSGIINVHADNVQITNFTCKQIYNFGLNLLAQDGIVNGSTGDGGVQYSNYTLRRVEVKNSFDGLKGFGNITLEDCWVHQMCAQLGPCGNRTDCGGSGNTGGGYTHNDGWQIGGGVNMSALRTRFELTGYNSGIFLDPDGAPITGVTLDQVYSQGGNYAFFIVNSANNANPVTGVTVRNCIAGPAAICSPSFAGESSVTGVATPTWVNNIKEDGTALPLNSGATPANKRTALFNWSKDGRVL